MNDFYPLRSNLATAHAMIVAERTARLNAEARAQSATLTSSARVEIGRLKRLLAKADVH